MYALFKKMFNQVRSHCKTCKHKTIYSKIVLQNICHLKTSFIIQNALIQLHFLNYSLGLMVISVFWFCFLSLACTINRHTLYLSY